MGSWRLIGDPPGGPAANMAADEQLVAQSLLESRPLLRLYRWDRPAVSLGRRQKKEELPSGNGNLPLVWRPTGGGAVFHTTEEFTYALALPRAQLPPGMALRELPCFLHRRLRETVVAEGWLRPEELTLAPSDPSGPAPLCFSAPARGDLLHQGRKVAGSALRVWREGVLIQGSIQGLPVEYNRLAGLFSRIAEEGFRNEKQGGLASVHCGGGQGPGLG